MWIVGVTNAINLLDNMDALAAGVSAVAALSVFALAILGRQPVVATLAAAVAGACLGFLVYNRPPASIFMGDAGSLFLGFVLAILTINVSPAVFPPVSFLIPLLLLAIPVLDTTVVTLARLRRGRPVSQGGRDHLSHRLAKRGLRRRTAVAVLIGCESVLGMLAVLAGRRVMPGGRRRRGGGGHGGGLLAVTAKAKVYREPVVGFPRRLQRAVVAILPGHARAGRARGGRPGPGQRPGPGRRRSRQPGPRRLPGGRLRGQRGPLPRGQRPSWPRPRSQPRRAAWCRSGCSSPACRPTSTPPAPSCRSAPSWRWRGSTWPRWPTSSWSRSAEGDIPLDRLKRLTPALDRAVARGQRLPAPGRTPAGELPPAPLSPRRCRS